jgi:hypothetical protein
MQQSFFVATDEETYYNSNLQEKDLSSEAAFKLYKQPVRPLMEHACPTWGSVARIHVAKLTVLKWRLTHFIMLALRKFTKMWKFRFTSTTSHRGLRHDIS